MNDDAVFDQLVEATVLTETEDGEIGVAEVFDETVAEKENYIETTTDNTLRDELQDFETPPEYVDRLINVAESAPTFLAQYLTIRQAAGGLDFETAIRVTLLIDDFDAPTPPTDGSPDHFFSVRGETLPTLLTIFPVAIVYIWREECPECDTVRDDLEAIFSEPPSDISLFSIYGPDCASFLEDEYNVVGGPTTLFVVDGEIDSRLQGAHFKQVLETEIREMRKTAEGIGIL